MVCPICTIAVGAGLGISRTLGIDDTITGLWIGALILSISLWTIDWLNRKNIKFLFRKILVLAAYYLITIWPLYHWHYIGISGNTLFGIDKILLGTIIGTIIFALATLSDGYLRKHNNGKVLINYQKVLVPITFLIVTSIITYLLLKIYRV